MSWEILDQVDDDFSVIDKKVPSVDLELAKKIENVFFFSIGQSYCHGNKIYLKPQELNLLSSFTFIHIQAVV